jgi:hypothetical protein
MPARVGIEWKFYIAMRFFFLRLYTHIRLYTCTSKVGLREGGFMVHAPHNACFRVTDQALQVATSGPDRIVDIFVENIAGFQDGDTSHVCAAWHLYLRTIISDAIHYQHVRMPPNCCIHRLICSLQRGSCTCGLRSRIAYCMRFF